MAQFLQSIRSFAADDEGSEVVEYALIIALVSIVLAVALGSAGIANSFNQLVTRLNSCFAANATSC